MSNFRKHRKQILRANNISDRVDRWFYIAIAVIYVGIILIIIS